MDDLIITATFVSEATGITHANRLKVRDKGNYLQFWLKSGVLGSASIRLEDNTVDKLYYYLQQYRERSHLTKE